MSPLAPLLAPMLELCRAAACTNDEDSLVLALEIFQDVSHAEPRSRRERTEIAHREGIAHGSVAEIIALEIVRGNASRSLGCALEGPR